jgi:hypothetical protein
MRLSLIAFRNIITNPTNPGEEGVVLHEKDFGVDSDHDE